MAERRGDSPAEHEQRVLVRLGELYADASKNGVRPGNGISTAVRTHPVSMCCTQASTRPPPLWYCSNTHIPSSNFSPADHPFQIPWPGTMTKWLNPFNALSRSPNVAKMLSGGCPHAVSVLCEGHER